MEDRDAAIETPSVDDLDDAIETPWMARGRIIRGLRELRKATGMSQPVVAGHVDYSLSMIGMVESGKRFPSEELLGKLLACYGADDRTVKRYERWHDLAQRSDFSARALADGSVLLGFDEFLSAEHSASKISAYETRLVPGLVQTRDYAWAVLQTSRNRQGIERKLAIRMMRQEILTRSRNPVVLRLLMDEQVLNRPVGSPQVMRAQCDHLINLAELPNVTIQVLPISIGPAAPASGSLIALEFPNPEDPAIAAMEAPHKTVFFRDPDELKEINKELEDLRSLALPVGASTELIAAKREEV